MAVGCAGIVSLKVSTYDGEKNSECPSVGMLESFGLGGGSYGICRGSRVVERDGEREIFLVFCRTGCLCRHDLAGGVGRQGKEVCGLPSRSARCFVRGVCGGQLPGSRAGF